MLIIRCLYHNNTYIKPTQSLHDTYMYLHNYWLLWADMGGREMRNLGLKGLKWDIVIKFSRELNYLLGG